MPPAAPAPSLRVAAAFLTALLVAATASFVVRHWDQHRLPATETVLRGNGLIRDRLRPRDALRPAPLWFADARLELGAMPILMSDPMDTYERHRLDRLWLAYSVSHADWVERDAAGWIGHREVVFDEAGYRVEVAELLPEDVDVAWDGYTDIRSAFVAQRTPQQRETLCDRWLNQSWNCGRYDEWIHVGPAIRGMGDEQPYACIEANAPPDGKTWRVRWGTVPAAGRVLRFRAGLTFEAIRSTRGGPLTLQVFVDERPVFERVFNPNDRSWDEAQIPLGSAETASVRFEIGAPDYQDRFFCFRPQAVRPRARAAE